MKRRIILTGDGSTTIQIEEWQEQYHSTHGAIREAEHVFINSGLDWIRGRVEERPLKILEFGFGTGLNALLSFKMAEESKLALSYISLEAYPVTNQEVTAMNYDDQIGYEKLKISDLHALPWETFSTPLPEITFKKMNTRFEDFYTEDLFHLVYYDAFGARVQPELWIKDRFQAIYEILLPGGALVTYSSKGSVRRAMEEIGYSVERLKGPPGKRHMLRASKI